MLINRALKRLSRFSGCLRTRRLSRLCLASLKYLEFYPSFFCRHIYISQKADLRLELSFPTRRELYPNSLIPYDKKNGATAGVGGRLRIRPTI
jgi:hypothetical protein